MFCFLEMFFGVVFAYFIFLFLFWKLILKIALVRKLPPRAETPKIPLFIIEELMKLDKQHLSEGESATWFNMLCQMGFKLSQPGQIKLLEKFVENEFKELPHDIRRTAAGYLIKDARLVDYHFGGSFPVFSNFHTIKIQDYPNIFSEEASDPENILDYKGLSAVVNSVEYCGELEAHFQFDIIFGRTFELYVCLERVEGRLFFIFHKDYMHYGYNPSNLKVHFNCRFLIDGWWESFIINFFLKRFVFPIIFNSKFVIPKLKGKWVYNKPKQPPYPWDLEKENMDELFYWTPKP